MGFCEAASFCIVAFFLQNENTSERLPCDCSQRPHPEDPPEVNTSLWGGDGASPHSPGRHGDSHARIHVTVKPTVIEKPAGGVYRGGERTTIRTGRDRHATKYKKRLYKNKINRLLNQLPLWRKMFCCSTTCDQFFKMPTKSVCVCVSYHL